MQIHIFMHQPNKGQVVQKPTNSQNDKNNQLNAVRIPFVIFILRKPIEQL